MRKPKYSVGTRVKHVTTGKWGTVVEVFVSDYQGGAPCEYRYYVNHSRFTWSVPEACLISEKPAAAPA